MYDKTTTTALPNGTVIQTANVGEKGRVWGCDGTPAQSGADIRHMYCDGDGSKVEARAKKLLPFPLCSAGLEHAVEHAENFKAGHVLTGWDKGNCPDLPDYFTVEGLEEMAGPGYTKGVERLAEFTAKIADKVPVPEAIRSRYRWSDEGDDYDINRTYSGDFEHAFGGWDPGAFKGPRVVTLYVPGGGSCSKGWEEMFWLAAGGIAVADVLSKAGFAVEIYSLSCTWQADNVWSLQRMKLKAAGDYANLSSLAYGGSMTALFRIFGFRMNAFNPYAHGWGWGQMKVAAECKPELEALGWLGDTASTAILFDMADNERDAMTAATKALKELATQIDIEVEAIT